MKTNLLILQGLMLLAAQAQALNQMTLVGQYQGENYYDEFGSSLTMGDFDGDGLDEFIIGALGWNGYRSKNYFYEWNGAWPDSAAWTMIGPDTSLDYDYYDANLGDVNDDGIEDFGLLEWDYPTSFGVHVFYGGADFDSLPDWSMWPGQQVSYMAHFLDSCGDVNGDGGADFGWWRAGPPPQSPGGIQLYFGGLALDTIPDWQISSGNDEVKLFGLGDVNGDAFDDILVTSWSDPVRLFYGGNPMDTIPDLIFYDYAGGRVAGGVGDVNADGFSDFCIDLRLPDSTLPRACLFFGGAEIDSLPDLILEDDYGLPEGAIYDFCHGDFNNDGYSDITNSSGRTPFGNVVWIYLGGQSFNPVPDALVTEWSSYWHFGSAVATGDVNGDGSDELLVGSPFWQWGDETGRAYMWTGPDEWIDYGAAVSPQDLQRQPQGFLLAQNFPNPFNATTSIHFEMARPGVVKLTVYDLRGNRVKNLISGQQMSPGGYNVSWTGVNENQQSVSSGIYLLELKLDQYHQVRKIALLR